MNNSRIEKKFVFGKYQDDLIEKLLLINNFSKIYPDRIKLINAERSVDEIQTQIQSIIELL